MPQTQQAKYITPMGLTCGEYRQFLEFMIKANDMQLEAMQRRITSEIEKRDL